MQSPWTSSSCLAWRSCISAGDEVYLCFDVRYRAYADDVDGASATIKIVEKDADGNNDPVTTLSAVVSGGKIKCQWQVTYTADEDDVDSQQELAEKGYTLPEYAFVVECGGVTSGESGVLEVRGWVDIRFNELEYQLLKDYQFDIYSDEWKSDDIQFRNGVLSFKELPFLINKKWNLRVKF